MFRLKATAFILAAAMVLTTSTGQVHAQAVDLATLINQYRQQQGQPVLAITSSVTCVASQVAADRAAAAQPGTHNPSLTFSLFLTCGAGNFVGEIAAGNGAGTSAAATLAQFVASPEHNAIILDGGNALGCGYATGTYLGFAGFQSWTCDFATLANPQPQPLPSPQPTPNPQPGCLAPLCGSTTGTGSLPGPSNGGTVGSGCFSFNCASTAPSTGIGSPGNFAPGFSTSGGAAASTNPGAPSSGSSASTGSPGNFQPGAPASTGSGTSSSGGAAAGTGGTICLPPTCASTGR